jgi:hypothetical protein
LFEVGVFQRTIERIYELTQQDAFSKEKNCDNIKKLVFSTWDWKHDGFLMRPWTWYNVKEIMIVMWIGLSVQCKDIFKVQTK